MAGAKCWATSIALAPRSANSSLPRIARAAHSTWPHCWSEPRLEGKQFIENGDRCSGRGRHRSDTVRQSAVRNLSRFPAGALGQFLAPPQTGAALVPSGDLFGVIRATFFTRELDALRLSPEQRLSAHAYKPHYPAPQDPVPAAFAYKANPAESMWANAPLPAQRLGPESVRVAAARGRAIEAVLPRPGLRPGARRRGYVRSDRPFSVRHNAARQLQCGAFVRDRNRQRDHRPTAVGRGTLGYRRIHEVDSRAAGAGRAVRRSPGAAARVAGLQLLPRAQSRNLCRGAHAVRRCDRRSRDSGTERAGSDRLHPQDHDRPVAPAIPAGGPPGAS